MSLGCVCWASYEKALKLLSRALYKWRRTRLADDFTDRLLDIHSRVANEGLQEVTLSLCDSFSAFTECGDELRHRNGVSTFFCGVQRFALGLHRSDYMLDMPTGRLLQVEINTISSSFVGLGPRVSSLHKYEDSSRLLCVEISSRLFAKIPFPLFL